MTHEELLEYSECFTDPTRIKFIEKYLSTFDASVERTHSFVLFPRQKAFLRSIAENDNSIAIKHRQAGITTITSAWITGQLVFATKDHPETVLCIGNKLDLSEQLVEKIKAFILQVPQWFWGEEFRNMPEEKFLKKLFKKETKDHLELMNGCKVYARSSGENAARGISAVSILVFDEAAFIENGPSVYSSAVAAASTVKHHKVVMISTPNGKDQLYYTTYQQAITKENNYNAVEFRWFQDPRFNKNLVWFKKDKGGNVETFKEPVLDLDGHIEYNEEHWREMEKEGWKPSSPWYEQMKMTFNNDSIKIAQELDVSFLGSSNNVLPQEAIEEQNLKNVRNPLADFVDPLEENTWFWKKPIDGHRYILAIDASRGDSADRTAMEMIDMDGRDENGMPIVEQVMEYYGKKPADLVGELAYRYGTLYNNAHIVIDCVGGVGDPVALTLMRKDYKNLFYDDNTLKDYTRDNFENRLISTQMGKIAGFHSGSLRTQMLSAFAAMIRNNEFKVRSKRVTNEMETWVFTNTGRMDHLAGKHDDTLTCLAMGLFVMQFHIMKAVAEKSRDAAMLKAWCTTSSAQNSFYKEQQEREMQNRNASSVFKQTSQIGLPQRGTGYSQQQINPYFWLFNKKR